MSEQNSEEYLLEFTQPKPSSYIKLKSVLADLSTETKIKILLILKENIPDELFKECLASEDE